MKPLSEVTKEDAIAILSVAYNFFHVPQAWKLTDETEEIKEPCKKFRSPGRAYQFWFFDDKLDVEPEDDLNKPVDLFDCTNYDVKLACYVKAYELGYNVPAFSRFTTAAGNSYPKEFVKWYSGMDQSKIDAAFERWQSESPAAQDENK